MTAELAIRGGSPVRTRPFPQWPIFDQAELSVLTEVLKSGTWGLGGENVPLLEQRFAEYQNVRHGIAASSGTATLEMALKAVGVRRGDEVIIPPYTFYATMSAVLAVNGTPVFADIEEDSYCIDPERIAGAITERTRAIMPVFFAGRPADMDGVLDIARRHDLRIVVDAAQAHASEWRGCKAGGLGDISSFSFQSSKNVTSGEGGMLTTNDAGLAALSRSYGNCGREEGRPWYEHYRLGSNYRMTEFQAALLLCQLQRLDAHTKRREESAEHLTTSLSDIPGLVPLPADPRITRHTYHIFVLKYKAEEFNGVAKEVLLQTLRAEGIPAHSGYIPLYRSPMFVNGQIDLNDLYKSSHPPDPGEFPVTEWAANDEAIWLPHTVLLGDRADMQDIVDAFAKVREHCHMLGGSD